MFALLHKSKALLQTIGGVQKSVVGQEIPRSLEFLPRFSHTFQILPQAYQNIYEKVALSTRFQVSSLRKIVS